MQINVNVNYIPKQLTLSIVQIVFEIKSNGNKKEGIREMLYKLFILC